MNLHFCHIAQYAEDDKSCYKAGSTVDGAIKDIVENPLKDLLVMGDIPCNQGIFITVIVEFVVARKSQKSSKAGPKREEYLCCCCNPNLRCKEKTGCLDCFEISLQDNQHIRCQESNWVGRLVGALY